MSKISICIPLETTSANPERLIKTLLNNGHSDIEIIAAGTQDTLRAFAALEASAENDARLTLVALDAGLDRQKLWRRTAEAATGDWVTLVNPADMIENDLDKVALYVEETSPETDAIGWNSFSIAANAKPETAASIAVPASFHINLLDKTEMLKAFFYWEGSLEAPKMPFGLFHGLVRRSLLDAMLQLPESEAWSTPVPQYEWATKVLLFAEKLAFCARPLSAADSVAYAPPANAAPSLGFPFHAGIGLTAAVAEVQHHVLAELGSQWNGGDAAFVRACIIDCMRESVPEAFNAKCNAYYAALRVFDNGRLADAFQPKFAGERTSDRRRGLHGEALLVDRFIGGARTAQDFYAVMRGMIAPIGLICGGVTK